MMRNNVEEELKKGAGGSCRELKKRDVSFSCFYI